MPLARFAVAPERLFGREEFVERVTQVFAEGARLVTLVGPGGVGKTAVGRGIASRCAPAYAGGQVVCELSELQNARGFYRAVAQAWSVPTPRFSDADEDANAVPDVLVQALVGRAAFVFLNDADGVIDAAGHWIRRAIQEASGATFLVTSREPLGIAGECVVEVPTLDREAAKALFENEARGGSWSAEQLDALVEHLDGLPLALVLAARRSRVLPPFELLKRLDNVLRLLKSDKRDVAARHATLDATIAWSLVRLPSDEARAFAYVGIFEGPFTVDAFEAVVGSEIKSDALDLADALLRKSLVVSEPSKGAAKLTLLRTMRACARAHFDALEADERIDVEGRYATYYLERAEADAERTYGATATASLDAIEAALPHLLAAFERTKNVKPDLAARLAVALCDVVVFRNVVDLASPIFEQARDAADRSDNASLRVRVRVLAAKVQLERGNASDAQAHLLDALRIAHTSDCADTASVYRSLAWARIALGDGQGAIEAAEEALVGHRRVHDVRGEADAFTVRGLVRALQGEGALATSDFEQAYAIHVVSGDELRQDKVREVALLVGLSLGPEDAEGSPSARAMQLRAAAEAHEAAGRTWRAAIARFRAGTLEHEGAPAGWTVGAEARWLMAPGGERISLARHGSLRRVLDALVERHLEAPGAALSAMALLDVGWPDERVQHDSGMLRVYSVVRRLRALGLGSALLTRDDGYLLDPACVMRRAT
jgi:predicted ATPase